MQVLIQNLKDLIIPEGRTRKEFLEKDNAELAESIVSKGLFHAPTVMEDGLTLVGGERRIRAITKLYEEGRTFSYNSVELKLGEIPVIRIGASSKIEVKEAELDENIRRLNLTWQEESAAVAELHELRSLQKKEKGEKKQTKSETASELYPSETDSDKKYGIEKLNRNLLLSGFLDHPEVMKAKTPAEASKIVEKMLIDRRRIALAKNYNLHQNDGCQIIQGDAFEELVKLDNNKFDLIITDPPYGIDADKFTNQSASKHTYSDDFEYASEITELILKEGLRITKEKAHLYMFLDISLFYYWKEKAEELGWYVWNTPLIWYKGTNVGILPRPNHGPRRCYEVILYGIKGNKEIKIMAASDVLVIPHDREIDRAAHKPDTLYEELIKRSCDPGDVVLDPTCGTGPIFSAALRMKVDAVGIENDPIAIGVCSERIEKAKEMLKGV